MNPEPSPASGSDDYLSRLNEAQRQAVTHGTGVSAGGADSSPLLVIAGAGSGKTNTLAHRVAHLIASGADPRRILLLTFSRRASVEMTRRVERICKTVLGDKAGPLADALAWAGTFHSIGARLLREYRSVFTCMASTVGATGMSMPRAPALSTGICCLCSSPWPGLS
ncbi:UvrD-helicase domain-containing protein [Novacetimonas hansenii]|uniref:UvrD-like helicase ATP-binding domain-containing protein n=2 Tax=Novacetimonas hansenii TaxID=436 RepID=A0ABQ0SJN4_NOVHA|nr:UvrD-helicase domain-containing protein [Novacetimonas hansenii]EFG85470.1 putative DNA helicase II [Novacetimonas hansenii ATCC 23769]GBQ61477.1 DNA helicase II [Novacetimonas hansenii NRIC 0243]GEC65135.1 hypothetical protein GHA01_29840 [Novacetimonas hansenii]